MDPTYKVFIIVNRPRHDVFEAVADPKQLSEYFTTGGAQGRLETGATVTWNFHDFPGAFPVDVISVVRDEQIILEWAAGEGEAPNVEGGEMSDAGYKTRVTMTFKPIDDGNRTLVEIKEEGWRETQKALEASYGNCQGWSQMLCALKVWLERGFNLRDGLYV